MKNTTVVLQLLRVCSTSMESEAEEDAVVVEVQAAPLPLPTSNNNGGGASSLPSLYKRRLSKKLSMRETKMEAKWEKRRRQILQRRCAMERGAIGEEEEEEEEAAAAAAVEGGDGRTRSLTDEDLDELRGSIELGFGFNEEEGGHDLCDTLPALNLYFAVNRQLSPSPVSTPTAISSSSTLCGIPSPRSPTSNEQPPHSAPSDAWKILNPGDSPQHVKTRLRHWALAVACSLRQSC